jgi:hypothetical protein
VKHGGIHLRGDVEAVLQGEDDAIQGQHLQAGKQGGISRLAAAKGRNAPFAAMKGFQHLTVAAAVYKSPKRLSRVMRDGIWGKVQEGVAAQVLHISQVHGHRKQGSPRSNPCR